MGLVMEWLTWSMHYLDLQLFLVCSSLCLCLFFYLRRPRNLPPGPFGVPILGCFPTIALALYTSKLKPHQLFKNLAVKYGNIFSLQICGVNIVVLNSYDDIKTAFQNPNLNDRPRFPIYDELNLKPGLIFNSGESLKQHRQFVLSMLRDFGVGKTTFEEQITTETKALVNEFLLQQGKAFDPSHIINNAVSNVICSVAFGTRYDYSDENFKRLLLLVDEITKLAQAGGFQLCLPFARYIQPKQSNQMVKTVQHLFAFISQVIEEHRLHHDPANPNNFISVFLGENDLHQKEASKSYLSKESFEAIIADIFLAGSGSTATTLRWSLLYMITYPDLQRKVQQEIDNIVGRDRLPQLSDKSQLPFTEATLLEIQRVTSIAKLGAAHRAAESTNLNGFDIPKGTYLISNLWAVHNDPQVWEEPSKFKPSRFLDRSGKVRKRKELIPFSIGGRVCLGENLAKMESFLFFSHMMHQFSLMKPADSSVLSSEDLHNIVNGHIQPFDIFASYRG